MAEHSAHLRKARTTTEDAAAIQAIYAPIVRHTIISFEIEVPTVEAMRDRIVSTGDRWPWLVYDRDGVIEGYAYASEHRTRPAYRWSVDVSAYVDERYRRRGVARALYAALLDRLRAQGFCNAFAGIALPNEPSVAFHEAMGFEPVGVYKNVGYKLGAWHDVGWWGLALKSHPRTPEPPQPVTR